LETLGFYVNDAPSGWVEVNGALEREFEFEDFAAALAFVNRVADAAEEADHHPDIEIHWNRVRLRWWTHATGSITDRDRRMAARTNELV
jgi:4a-hydroxytetrahydrobiopterin dehydratase